MFVFYKFQHLSLSLILFVFLLIGISKFVCVLYCVYCIVLCVLYCIVCVVLCFKRVNFRFCVVVVY